MPVKKTLLQSVAFSAMLAASGALHAQSQVTAGAPSATPGGQELTQSDQLPDITVTAQRRSERLQDVPITVSHVTGERLQSVGISDITSIKVAVPGANVRLSAGYTQPYIRGVGSSAKTPLNEPPIATYVDDVYIASGNNVISFNNIDSIEVLKGPQGTLFGRNATGGLFNIRTVDPSFTPTGKFHVGYGNYDTISGDGYLSTGLSSRAAVDLAFIASRQGTGFGRNLTTGEDAYKNDRNVAVRSKLLFIPDDKTRIILIGDYSTQQNSLSSGHTFLPGTFIGVDAKGAKIPAPFVSNNPFDIVDDTQPLVRAKTGGVALVASRRMDAGFLVKSISSLRWTSFFQNLDGDATAFKPSFSIEQHIRERTFSQELQLQSTGRGPFTWTAGEFYFNAWSPVSPQFNTSTSAAGVASTTHYEETFYAESIAGYAQGTYAITPNTHLTLGARYTKEWRNLIGSVDSPSPTVSTNGVKHLETKASKPTFRLSLDHKITPDLMIYGSFNTGFKSGGYSHANFPGYVPETLRAYEAGFKSQMLDRRVTLNASAFYYDYKDIQVQLIMLPFGSFVTNGAGAHMKGVDVDLSAKLTPTLSLNAGFEGLQAKFTRFDSAPIAPPGFETGGRGNVSGSAAGKYVPFAPKYSANLGLVHRIPLADGTLTSSVLAYFSGRYYLTVDNNIGQAPYTSVNGSIQWESNSGISVKIWGNNITNHLILSAGQETAVRAATYDPPRTYGVTVGYKF